VVKLNVLSLNLPVSEKKSNDNTRIVDAPASIQNGDFLHTNQNCFRLYKILLLRDGCCINLK
jgi:hypothetical protein